MDSELSDAFLNIILSLKIIKVRSSCPLLIILKSALFRGLRVYELKFRSKKDKVIIFSSES
eukprot:UN13895